MTKRDSSTGHNHSGAGHNHSGAGHSHVPRGEQLVRQRRALWISVGANSVLLAVQVAVGLVIGSLALLADSLHNASDVVALVVALIGQALAARPPTARRSYGLARAEVLAALLNGTVLVALTIWVVVEAVGRFSDPPELSAGPLALVGLVGLLVNGASAWLLSRSAGDNLIQPVDINAPLPQDVVATNGVLNTARPYVGFAGINYRQTTAKSRYNGLLVGFRHDAGRKGLVSVAYTLSRSKTDATNDRDAVDLPQDRTNLDAEYALSRTDRTHVFTVNYVYELPFFRDSKGLGKQVLGGWQVSGITQFWSGPPISRVVNGQTNGGRRGIRVNQISDPFASLPANVPGGVYYFNPGAFAPPADGAFGDTGRAIFRLPGVNQWDITASKNWYPSKNTRLQFRADFINAFNHTQFDPNSIQNVCSVAVTAANCTASTGNFGKLTGTRAPREIQLGIKFFWN